MEFEIDKLIGTCKQENQNHGKTRREVESEEKKISNIDLDHYKHCSIDLDFVQNFLIIYNKKIKRIK